MPRTRSKTKKRKSAGHATTSPTTSGAKRPKSPAPSTTVVQPRSEACLNSMSLEILCLILGYLPVRDVLKVESLSRRLQQAVHMHLQLLTELDLCEGQLYGWVPPTLTDPILTRLLAHCIELVYLFGLHPKHINKRRQRTNDSLSIPGVLAALRACPNLQGVETCDIFLLEAVTSSLPSLSILGAFKNRGSNFPITLTNKISLSRNSKVSSLHLTSVVISHLPRMDHLKHLYLKWVKMTEPHPFHDFGVPMLRTFVMSNCAGPTNALKYVPLITGLAAARSLTRLELVRVPFLGGLIQHVVEDSWKMHGFRSLQKVVLGSCKHTLEVDLGYLCITCCHRLEEVAVQPSLTKDSFFSSLALADVTFPVFDTLRLGYVDDFVSNCKWTNQDLVTMGLADYSESPAMITDIGMRAAALTFQEVRVLHIYNCPLLHMPTAWCSTAQNSWAHLRELHLVRCHAINLDNFCRAVPMLLNLQLLTLTHMFHEPPKGCSRVGLSAGTGLGVSSALVSNTAGADAAAAAANQDGANNNAPAQPMGDDDDDDTSSSSSSSSDDDDIIEEEVAQNAGNAAADPIPLPAPPAPAPTPPQPPAAANRDTTPEKKTEEKSTACCEHCCAHPHNSDLEDAADEDDTDSDTSDDAEDDDFPAIHAGSTPEHLGSAQSSTESKDSAQSSTESKDSAQSSMESKDSAQSSTESKDTEKSSTDSKDGAQSSTDSKDTEKSSTDSKDSAQSSTDSKDSAQSSTESKDSAQSSTDSKDSAHSSTDSKDSAQSSTESKDSAQISTDSKDSDKSSTESKDSVQSSTESKDSAQSSTESKDSDKSSTESKDSPQSSTESKDSVQSGTESKDRAQSCTESKDSAQSSTGSTDHAKSSTESMNCAQGTVWHKVCAQCRIESKDSAQSRPESINSTKSSTESKDSGKSIIKPKECAECSTDGQDSAPSIIEPEKSAQCSAPAKPKDSALRSVKPKDTVQTSEEPKDRAASRIEPKDSARTSVEHCDHCFHEGKDNPVHDEPMDCDHTETANTNADHSAMAAMLSSADSLDESDTDEIDCSENPCDSSTDSDMVDKRDILVPKSSLKPGDSCRSTCSESPRHTSVNAQQENLKSDACDHQCTSASGQSSPEIPYAPDTGEGSRSGQSSPAIPCDVPNSPEIPDQSLGSDPRRVSGRNSPDHSDMDTDDGDDDSSSSSSDSICLDTDLAQAAMETDDPAQKEVSDPVAACSEPQPGPSGLQSSQGSCSTGTTTDKASGTDTTCARCGKCVDAPNGRELQRSQSVPSTSSSGPAACHESRKGKSLRGKKKGLVKRTYSDTDSSQVNQSCQAVSEEIRESTKKVPPGEGDSSKDPESEAPKKLDPDEPDEELKDDPELVSTSCGTATLEAAAPRTRSGSASGSEARKAAAGCLRRRVSTRDQATSTSDPVVEEDHAQELTIKSTSLTCVNLHHVGVTRLVLDELPKLEVFTASACRVLSVVKVKTAPKLGQVSVAQCRKLQHADMVDSVLSQPAVADRHIILRPLGQSDDVPLERQLLSCARYQYHMCLVRDHHTDPELSLPLRHRLESWVDLASNINQELIKSPEVHLEEGGRRPTSTTDKYPWGRDIYTLRCLSGSGWELTTDISWFRPLQAIRQALANPDSKGKPGEGEAPRPSPYINLCRNYMQDDLAESEEVGRCLYKHCALVYINTCDTDGIPTSDKYV